MIWKKKFISFLNLKALQNTPGSQTDPPIDPNEGQPLYPSQCLTYELSTFRQNKYYEFGFNKFGSLNFPDLSNQVLKFNPQVLQLMINANLEIYLKSIVKIRLH